MLTSEATKRILVADDEPLFLITTGELLKKAGFECRCASDAETALKYLASERFDLILSDLNVPGNLKLELLREGREKWPEIPLVVVTGVPSLPTAIESVRLGISDYLLKPVKFDDLIASIQRILRPENTSQALNTSGERKALLEAFPDIITQGEAMLEVLEVIDRVAPTNTNVLITGESGTGKEVVARAIHERSSRRDYPFQVIDCTSIPESLFESIVFGHRKGSFTGAVANQEGLLERSQHGTVFFDELGELPLLSQAKLLRAVQERSYTPVGDTTPIQFDARFICATNRALESEVLAGRFRRDLFYRLGVVNLELPPLRERGEDVILLAHHFLEKLRNSDSGPTRFSTPVLERFREYGWPGNIRELRNVVERTIALARNDQIETEDLPRALQEKQAGRLVESEVGEISRETALDSADYKYLTLLLTKHNGNVSHAAEQAGISRQGIHKLLKKHGISAANFRA
ncbi:sigma-54-dependent Fis family transcriptional regulator [Bremerella cremea]|uniref:Sigma-54-dependent Fis family transcriptional regulator n=1 Tax=Bremerella cremea TaxID=1031537 RepID=A0A368KRP9_9BACT|nr:sigma-54 dependent transcriptional regulator [Bremerella cremea]RCS46459.1 sigma-54-dependent Fis family transcriptional regulator [Bremerella cremea]